MIYATQMRQPSGSCLKVHHTMKSQPKGVKSPPKKPLQGSVDLYCRVVLLGGGMCSEEETAYIIQ